MTPRPDGRRPPDAPSPGPEQPMTVEAKRVPTLAEWARGPEALGRLTAAFIGEVFGGPYVPG